MKIFPGGSYLIMRSDPIVSVDIPIKQQNRKNNNDYSTKYQHF